MNLVNVTALIPAEDSTAPAGAFELRVRGTRSRTQITVCILAPDHSGDDLFMGLGNAVPSHVTSDELWRRHMGSRPAIATEANPREYRVGKTLGTGTFGKVCNSGFECSIFHRAHRGPSEGIASGASAGCASLVRPSPAPEC